MGQQPWLGLAGVFMFGLPSHVTLSKGTLRWYGMAQPLIVVRRGLVQGMPCRLLHVSQALFSSLYDMRLLHEHTAAYEYLDTLWCVAEHVESA